MNSEEKAEPLQILHTSKKKGITT